MLTVVSEAEADGNVCWENYQLVIVDATVVGDVERFVFRTLARRPNLRIMVLTSAATWRETRAIMHAGAIDCLHTSMSRRSVLAAVGVALSLP